MSGPAVKITDLTQTFGPDTVLDLPSLSFQAGRVHVLVGGNGAGKTTLLRIIAGLDRPSTGSVALFGRSLSALSRRARLATLRRTTMCFQKPYLFNASVRRNIEYGLLSRRQTAAERDQRVARAIEALGLSSLRERNARTLSAGESQRVSLARALVLEPDLALLDEPVANVDQVNKGLVEQAIGVLSAAGCTVVVATHQLDQAYRLSANVTRLDRGRLAPPALDNLLEGEVVQRNGEMVMVVGSTSIEVTGAEPGFARAAVEPGVIVLSRKPLTSSARNCFSGKVTALQKLDRRVSVTVDIGIALVVHITGSSFRNLEITLGSEVYLTFKATAVTVF
jgi:tungstate transport system ATP-binding protein